MGKCTHDELVNAYDNTILYEDYFLFCVIGVLRKLHDTATLLIYVSDHGESLGEHGMYLHGIPYSIAPDVQSGRLESQRVHSQRDIFHTVMGAFSMHSKAYSGKYDIFSESFSDK